MPSFRRSRDTPGLFLTFSASPALFHRILSTRRRILRDKIHMTKTKGVAMPVSERGKKRRADGDDDDYEPPKAKHAKAAHQQGEIAADIKPFPFLGLPPELRNHIYTYVINDDPTAYIRHSNRGCLVNNSGLSNVNRQIRDEFTSLLHVSATSIVAKVTNFDFSHIITFLNRLSEIDLETLPSTSHAANQKLIVRLAVRSRVADHRSKLQRWLNRLDHPTKKGTAVTVEYDADRTSYTVWNDVPGQLDRIADLSKNSGGRQEAALQSMRLALVRSR